MHAVSVLCRSKSVYFIIFRHTNVFCSFTAQNVILWYRCGTDAVSLKNGIDSIFIKHGSIHLEPNDYTNKFKGCTCDRASVNFGGRTRLMTRLATNRPRLSKIHCVELAVKHAIN